MFRNSIALLAAVCLISMTASAVQAQIKIEGGIVFAGRAETAEGKKAHVTFVGDRNGGLVSGRLVIGGYFISAEAQGWVDLLDDGTVAQLHVSAFDSDLGTNWNLGVANKGENSFFTINNDILGDGSFQGSGTNFITNVH